MINNIKNDKLLHLLKGEKYLYKRKNKCFCACVVLLTALLILGVLIYGQLRYTYGRLDIWDLSARTTYRDGVETIDDSTYFKEESVTTNSDGDIIPEMQLDNNILSLETNGLENVYLAWVYTGSQPFEYNGNYQWDEIVETGKSFSYNTSYGYRTAHDTTRLELTEDGWYTVFAIWYQEDHKLHVVKNFHVGSTETSGRGTEYEREAYNTWLENKNRTGRAAGVKNILFIGADHWDRKETSKSYSDYMVLVTINTNNREIVFTTILKESYVYIPSVGCGRLTNAYNCGGVELTVRTIEENYGLNIDNYILLDYNYFIQMIDIVGGIDVHIEAYQVPYINQYIESMEREYGLTSDIVKTDYLAETTGLLHLDGPQTLAYMRYYNEGDWARSERYEAVMEAFYKSLANTDLSTVINRIFPLFTTDLSFGEYTELLYYMPLYMNYDFSMNRLPCENRIAPFKESYRYNVLLNVPSELEEVVAYAVEDRGIRQEGQLWISPFIVMIYVLLVTADVIAILYMLIRRRRVVYVDTVTGKKKYKNKKYRWKSKVNVYHQNVLGEYRGMMFMNRELTHRYGSSVKMPMHDLEVYILNADIYENEDIFGGDEAAAAAD